jgi:hypothetical protein
MQTEAARDWRVVQQTQFSGAVGFWRRQSIEVDSCRVIDPRPPPRFD